MSILTHAEERSCWCTQQSPFALPVMERTLDLYREPYNLISTNMNVREEQKKGGRVFQPTTSSLCWKIKNSQPLVKTLKVYLLQRSFRSSCTTSTFHSVWRTPQTLHLLEKFHPTRLPVRGGSAHECCCPVCARLPQPTCYVLNCLTPTHVYIHSLNPTQEIAW